MESLTAFILPACGLFWVLTGVLRLRKSFKQSPDDQALAESAVAPALCPKIKARTNYGIGVFWIAVGLLCLGCSLPESPVVSFLFYYGLFWTVCGSWWIYSTWRKGPAGEVDPVASAKARAAVAALSKFETSRWGHWFWIAVGVATIAFSGIRVGGTPTARRPTSDSSSTISQDIDERTASAVSLEALVTQHVVENFDEEPRMGIVVGVVASNGTRDEESLLCFGQTSFASSEAPTPETLFEIGSISKTFTGLLLARAIQDGELSLDDRVAELLPQGWTMSEPAEAITLRHLTTHTSGLPRLPQNLFGVASFGRMLFGGDPYRHYSEDAFREALATVELESTPGEKKSYSNFGVGLLGFVLATHYETDYPTLIADRVAGPLGLQHTATTLSAGNSHASGYRGLLRLGPVSTALASSYWLLPNHLAGAGAVRSTGTDMLKYLKANMQPADLPADLVAAIEQSHEELFEHRPWETIGMNWIRSENLKLAQNILWHNGGTGGYRSYLGFTEDRQHGVVILSNTDVSVDELGERLLVAVVRRDSKPANNGTYARVAPWTGIRWEADQPTVEVDGEWGRLISIDGIAIEEIMQFANDTYRATAKERLAEDLVELLTKMGHNPDWDVTLELTDNSESRTVTATMTEEKRRQVRSAAK